MTLLRILAKIVLVAAAHLAACRLVVWTTMQLGMFAGAEGGAGILGPLLVLVTRVLYFPILTLSLYSRQMFPGNWILLPMAANSLIWGAVLYGGYRIIRFRRSRRQT